MELNSKTDSENRCQLAHQLLNQVAVIVGNCDILAEDVGVDAACVKRLAQVRETALGMAAKINSHDCWAGQNLDYTKKPAIMPLSPIHASESRTP